MLLFISASERKSAARRHSSPPPPTKKTDRPLLLDTGNEYQSLSAIDSSLFRSPMDSEPVLLRGRLANQDNVALTLSALSFHDGQVSMHDVVGTAAQGSEVVVYVYARQAFAPSGMCCCAAASAQPPSRVRSELRLRASDASDAQRWEQAIGKVLGRGPRPRRMLVFVNPFSGAGRARNIYDEHCAQVFADAGVQTTVVITTHMGHAAQVVQSDLALDFDAVVICSGDGLLHEVLQGLMARADHEQVLRRVALGVLPGGSGNGLAVTLCRAAGEPVHAFSNAFLIAKGYHSPIDISQVDHAGGSLYSFLSLEVGMIADVDLKSEWLRSLGEARFTVQAVLNLFRPRCVRARISWTSDARARIPALHEPVPEAWTSVEDDLYSLWACNCAWMSSSGNVAPAARVDDGLLHLFSVRKRGPGGRSPRRALLEFLLGIETGAHIEANCCDVQTCLAFRVDLPADGTQIAVDGEALPAGPIQFWLRPGLCTLIGSSRA
jgi:sphingosine kinase